jgi:hypothetical protein
MAVLGQRNHLGKARTGRAAPRCRVLFLTLMVILTLELDATETKGKLTREYDLKAAFLFNFAHFVDWPPTAFADTNAPITIGVLGEDPFGAVLDQIVEGETVKNRKLVVKRSQRVEDLKSCHVLFVSKSEKAHVTQILEALDDASILTVGEVEGFARLGGVTNFFLQGNKVRFEINAQSAKRKGLHISAQLLELGTEVGN